MVHVEFEALRLRRYLQRKFKLTNKQYQRMYRHWKRSGMLVALYTVKEESK